MSSKSFILRVGLFVSPVAVLLGGLEWRLHSIDNSYSWKHDRLEERLKKTEILILGSSHGLRGIRPELLPYPAFNLANVSQSLDIDRELFEAYQERMPRLRTIIIPISFFSFRERLAETEPFRIAFYRRYFGIPEEFTDQLELSTYSLLALYGPRESLRLIKEQSDGYSEADLDSLGFPLYSNTRGKSGF